MTAAIMVLLASLSTPDLECAERLIGEILGNVLLVKAETEDARVAGFRERYASALRKVLDGQFDRFESRGLRGEIDEVMSYAERAFGRDVAEKIVPDTKRYLRQAFRVGQQMRVVPDNLQVLWDKPRKDAVEWLVEHDRFWIGKVFPDHLAGDFRETITAGLKEGLGRKDIGKRLRDMVMGTPGAPAKLEYYTRVASTTVSRARNWGGVFSLHAAGFTSYEIRAVMDERTSPICRDMNGKVFRVRDAMASVRKALAGPPSAIEAIAPFPRYDAEAGDHYIEASGTRAYLGGKSTAWLADHGLSLPPYHCNCRTTYVVSREEYAERQQEEELIVSPKVPRFEPFTEKELAGKNAAQLRMLARGKKVKYFRVMNKRELMIVLTQPERCEEIARIAKARWQHKPVPDPRGDITRLTQKYRKKGVRELMETARKKGIRNFRVMTKDQLVTVLSDPSKHDAIQQAFRGKLRAARAARGRKPGTTRAEELGLEDVAARKRHAVEQVLSRADSHGWRPSENFRRRLKPWLMDFDLESLEDAAEMGLRIEAYDRWDKVPWRIGATQFAGLYQYNRYRIALVRQTRGTFDHEFGHFLDDVLRATRGGRGKVPGTVKAAVQRAHNEARKRVLGQMAKREPAWRYRSVAWSQDYGEFYRVPDLDTVSPYGLHSPSEFWAECVEAYMKKGDRLRVKEPKMYALIKKWVFSDREFLKWLLGGILEWSAA